MSGPDRKIILPPLGAVRLRLPDRMVEAVVSCVNDATNKVYPEIEQTTKLIESGQIKFVSRKELETIADSEKPTANSIIFNTLTRLGVDEVLLKRHYYYLESDRSYLAGLDAGNPELYLLALREGSGFDLDLATTGLATQLIFANLYMSSRPMVLENKSYWREVTRQSLHRIFSDVGSGGSSEIKEQDIAMMMAEVSAAQEILDDPGTSFVASGARVNVLCQGETLQTAQLRLGTTFNSRTIYYLGEEIRKKTFNLLKDRGILALNMRQNMQFDNDFNVTRSILRELELSTTRSIFSAYIESEIPLIYAGASSKRINSLEYPI